MSHVQRFLGSGAAVYETLIRDAYSGVSSFLQEFIILLEVLGKVE